MSWGGCQGMVQRYLDLLEKTFRLVSVERIQPQLARQEVTRRPKYYYVDNGIRRRAHRAVPTISTSATNRGRCGKISWSVERLKCRQYLGFVRKCVFLAHSSGAGNRPGGRAGWRTARPSSSSGGASARACAFVVAGSIILKPPSGGHAPGKLSGLLAAAGRNLPPACVDDQSNQHGVGCIPGHQPHGCTASEQAVQHGDFWNGRNRRCHHHADQRAGGDDAAQGRQDRRGGCGVDVQRQANQRADNRPTIRSARLS